jgi:hypothetical protein
MVQQRSRYQASDIKTYAAGEDPVAMAIALG